MELNEMNKANLEFSSDPADDEQMRNLMMMMMMKK